MGIMLKADKAIKKYLEKRYAEMSHEITAYVRGDITLKKVSKESIQILRHLGIYYKMEIYKWKFINGICKKNKNIQSP